MLCCADICSVYRCRSEIWPIIKGRSDLTVEYLDTSSEVERYLDPSTIRSLHRTSTTCDCRPRRTCPAIGSHLWCGRHAPWANWRAHICTCEHVTRARTHTRVHTHTCGPTRLIVHGRIMTCSGGLLVQVKPFCLGSHGPTHSNVHNQHFTCNAFNHAHLTHAIAFMCPFSRAQRWSCGRAVALMHTATCHAAPS